MKYVDLTLHQAERFRHPMEAFIAESDVVSREALVTFNIFGAEDEEYLLFYVEGELTDRQYEAVRAAVESGYYAEPRAATLDDVADALDCATSTATDHLKKAEARVMAQSRGRVTNPRRSGTRLEPPPLSNPSAVDTNAS